MSARLIDGTALAAQVRASVKPVVERLAQRGTRPGLAVILVGDTPASRAYVRNMIRACADTGMHSQLRELPGDISQAALLEQVRTLNDDPQIHGILIQLP